MSCKLNSTLDFMFLTKNLLKQHSFFIVFLLLTLIGFLVYGMSLNNAFVLDDSDQILNNQLSHSINNFPSFFGSSTFNAHGGESSGIYYKPLMMTVFSLLYTFFGPNPFSFHFVQLIVHIINSSLVFTLFYILLAPISISLALFLALIFLIHPANSESVLYISAFQEPLFFFFGISGVLLWLKGSKSIYVKSATVLLFLCSLLSKETGLLFFLILPVYDILHRKKIISSLSVLVVTVFLYSLLRFGLAHLTIYTPIISSPITKLPIWDRLFHIPFLIAYYLRLVFYPKDLSSIFFVIQSFNFRSLGLPFIIDASFIVLALIVGKLILKDTNHKRLYLFFSLWLLIGVGFHLQLMPLDLTASPRWLYFPLVGILGMIGLLIHQIMLKRRQVKTIVLIALLAILSILLVRTNERTRDWKNELTLVFHDIKDNPDDYYLENKFGVLLGQSGRLTEAEEHTRHSIELYPNATNWHTLGFIYLKKQEVDRAIEAFTTSTKYGTVFSTYFDLPATLLLYKDPHTAENFIQKSLQIFPQNSQLWLLNAIAQDKLGNHDEAIRSAKQSYDLSPNEFTYKIYTALSTNQTIDIPFSIE